MSFKKLLLLTCSLSISFLSHANSFNEKINTITNNFADDWQVNTTELASMDSELNAQAFISFGDGDSVTLLSQEYDSSHYYLVNYFPGKQAIYSDLIFDDEYDLEIYNRLVHLSSSILSASSEDKVKIENELKQITNQTSDTNSTLVINPNTRLTLNITRANGNIIFIQLVMQDVDS